ncbi:MAG: NifB/NifX family molybdenum-iron cluster-binding protein [Planctomycetota bacterium]
MKIAFTTSGDSLSAPLDSRFGRAPKFILYDLAAGTFEVIDNKQNLNAAQGAGIQSAQTVAQLGAEAVVTGHCGPKAFLTLQTVGVKVFIGAAGTVAEAVAAYKASTLKAAAAADVEGHWA